MKAFPSYYYQIKEDGMDLRDYFAAQAMQAFIAAPQGKFPHQTVHQYAVEDAYVIADAMMKARMNDSTS